MRSRIITVTLNPAIDETITIDNLNPGNVHRASAVRFDAGGKGVNVASCLADWISEREIVSTGIMGSGNPQVFEALFAAKHITDAFLRLPGETRVNIKLAHAGDTTDINLPGLDADPGTARKVLTKILDLAGAETIVLLAGSLPAGIGSDFYAELTAALNARGAQVLLDTSGAPLERALNGNALPYCIKPNRSELQYLCQRPLATDRDIITAAQELIARGLGLVVVSLGAEGSLYISRDQILRAALPAIQPASTVGAGDAMVAGIIAALCEGADLQGIARLATAFAAGKLGLHGPNLPPRAAIEELYAKVTITNIREQTDR